MARPEFNYISKDITDADILYEDNHLIAVNKRAGDIVQVDDTGDESLDEKVKRYIAQKYNKPNGAFLGVVHRLDRPVSGVILFAKTSKALERINKMFKARDMHKTYYAIVRKRPQPEAGTLVHYLIKNPQKNVTKAHDKEVAGSQRSELNYKLAGEQDGYYVIEVDPITGRPHQIRVQLSTLGCPIVGDNKYGYPRGSLRKSICLHARRLQFMHPVKNEPILIVAPLPKDGFWEKFEGLIA
ncbi:RluA family pseudouridine synthase [Mucilaginibacter phyllosphaerae]|uniref:23S rRNA pseudouridine1911/1915/1917 synthase n=1 Tax=Mucilaginibacter phyllosphaerae TaxID=1812349 RepID=A0A4Y8AK05_9SPHI|nr:RluA family pseudouridine synthase [Mucilaginibacter phyllosphaerae]MBB3967606.1 23S rRNA pseudouridine1911/1915/1917 synthase [Mucilaginibacter phyllosphaerae]TEW69337.1 RluA family pseudouridine synthase [Mucilaginibacter phyllosphaerae]GGH21657.1 RNA pseudouridine synthase [Mucilaginibacter phyllosphaerae]